MAVNKYAGDPLQAIPAGFEITPLPNGDWRTPPVIRSVILSSDGKVRVSAHADVLVTRVTVTILGEAGQSLEQGEAGLTLGVWWDDGAANHGRIQIEAWDLAGNVTRGEFDDPWIFTPFRKKTT